MMKNKVIRASCVSQSTGLLRVGSGPISMIVQYLTPKEKARFLLLTNKSLLCMDLMPDVDLIKLHFNYFMNRHVGARLSDNVEGAFICNITENILRLGQFKNWLLMCFPVSLLLRVSLTTRAHFFIPRYTIRAMDEPTYEAVPTLEGEDDGFGGEDTFSHIIKWGLVKDSEAEGGYSMHHVMHCNVRGRRRYPTRTDVGHNPYRLQNYIEPVTVVVEQPKPLLVDSPDMYVCVKF